MTPYVYIIKHLPSKKLYIGHRQSEKSNPSELLTEDGYKTSSKTVHDLISRDGLDSFVVVDIFIFKSGQAAYEFESLLLETFNAGKNPYLLNKNKNYFKRLHSFKGKKHSSETKRRMSESAKNRNRRPFSEKGKRNMRRAAKNRKRVILSEEQRKGKSERIKKTLSKHDRSGLNNGFHGKKHSEGSRKKMSASRQGHSKGVPKIRVSCIYCRKNVTVNIFPRFHGDNCKLNPLRGTC